jgi:hypothetical protein
VFNGTTTFGQAEAAKKTPTLGGGMLNVGKTGQVLIVHNESRADSELASSHRQQNETIQEMQWEESFSRNEPISGFQSPLY